MSAREVDLGNIDQLIDLHEIRYARGGIPAVVDWIESTFQPKTMISIARDLTDLSKIDRRIVYDRAILQLDKAGNETDVFYLKPIDQDALSSDLFLSIRLSFVETPFELLVYVE